MNELLDNATHVEDNLNSNVSDAEFPKTAFMHLHQLFNNIKA